MTKCKIQAQPHLSEQCLCTTPSLTDLFDVQTESGDCERNLLDEQLKKISNLRLTNMLLKMEQSRPCKPNINWDDDNFWKNIPNPSTSSKLSLKAKSKINFKNTENHLQFLDLMIESQNEVIKLTMPTDYKPKEFDPTKSKLLLVKYFKSWKTFVDISRCERTNTDFKKSRRQKLDKLIKDLKKRKKASNKSNPKENFARAEISVKQVESTIGTIKNRFEAQKSIIEQQKNKLQLQEKMINDLKLGILNDELEKSLSQTKIEIRKLFNDCSMKIKSKVPVLGFPSEEKERMMIASQKAPKMVMTMERKAMERAYKREIIMQRRRMIEETKRRMYEEALEKKKIQDEEEKRKNLEMLREKRKKELEMQKVRQARKEQYFQKVEKAVVFYNKKLIKRYFGNLVKQTRRTRKNIIKCEKYYLDKLKKMVLNTFIDNVEKKFKVKCIYVDWFYKYKLMARCLNILRQNKIDGIRSQQVAEDYYDFKLIARIFIHWHRYVCVRLLLEYKKTDKALQHYKKKLVFRSFYQWKSLPLVLKMEKEKELRKQRWRQKVWEILPDYKPRMLEDF